MNWVDWIIVAFLALGALITVNDVDKPRVPIRPDVAVLVVLVDVLLIIGLLLTH